MRLQNIVAVSLLFLTSSVYAQPAVVTSDKLVVDEGTTHTEIKNTEWGGSHGIFFGAKINYTGSDNLWGNGNAVYSHASGPYNFGAFSLGYIANGGVFAFYDGGLSTGANQPITWQPVMAFPRGGNVGIGTTEPQAKLHVNGDAWVATYLRAGTMPASTNGQFRILGQAGIGAVDPANNHVAYLLSQNGQCAVSAYNYANSTALPISLNLEQTTTFINRNGGGVVVGSSDGLPSGYRMAVHGNMITNKVVVKAQPWPDYVFEREYKLPTLKEVEAFILANKHLPGIIPAAEVDKNGLDLGGNQADLLRKIEELTLYAIDQDKRLAVYSNETKQLREQTAKQEQELADIKKQLQQILAGKEQK